MSELLRALLSYSRTGTSQLNYGPVSLSEVAKDAASDLEFRITQAKGSVEISELPAVDADAALLRQLFQNVISNSIKYRKESEPPSVKIYGGIADETCQVFIEDNGIGFDEAYCQKIFQPFQRLHGRSSPYSGTGMGLAICRKIVARHNGDITVKSIPGQGATFIVTLPLKQKAGTEWKGKIRRS
jgi:signal transduction histidine kinase